MTTVHANSAPDALIRLENIVGLAGIQIPYRPLRQQICSAIQVVVDIERMSDGKRRIVSIQEIDGLDGDNIRLREVFTFEQTGVEADGSVNGRFRPCGAPPACLAKLRTRGFALPDSLFSSTPSIS